MKKNRRAGAGILLLLGLIPYIAALFMRQGTQWKEGTNHQNRIVRTADGIEMDSEHYLIGVLGMQMPADYPMEALKAQAILARTWLYEMMGSKNEIEENALGENCFDAGWMKRKYKEWYPEIYRRLYQAIEQTKGMTVWYQGERILPLYHALSAEKTRKDETGTCPYLSEKECSNASEAKEYLQVVLLTSDEYLKRLQSIDPLRPVEEEMKDVEKMNWIRDESGYLLLAETGTCTFTGEEIAEAFGMQSLWIQAEKYGEEIRMISKGIGHGYGLSQWEAKYLAWSGWSAASIIEYFFQDVSIKIE